MRPPSYAAVVSTLALAVALSGSAYAAATIGSKQVRNGSLTGIDVKNGSIRSADVSGLKAKDFTGKLPRGPRGFAGSTGPAGPGARMEASGPLSVPPSADNSFEMDVEAYDTGGMYNAPDDFMTITQTGTYLVLAQVQFNGSAAQRQVRLVSGTTDLLDQVVDSGADSRKTLNLSTTVRLQAGTTLRLGTFQSNVSSIDVTNFNSGNDAWLSAQWVGN